ncbi:variable surface protein [Plasmodium gonderi]|uniref:Variable surface protein n=1 Tax=Plasmodium gonderi TaxID=77519 RepID=A0A1Y1JN64_PLAGO|nr:variable surface protein [Plasmodium gonderi]GAW84036.1 variable surface protein [Plasmodium gonderi]
MIFFNEESRKQFDELAVYYGLDLTSENFYDKIENAKNLSEFYDRCKSLSNTKYGMGVRNTCLKLLKYLKSNAEYLDKSDTYDICELLNYWLATKLSIFVGYKGDSYVKDAFADIAYIWNDFTLNELKKAYQEACNPLISILGLRDWRERKDVYEYYVNYKYLKGMSKIKKSHRGFCSYIRNKASPYNYFDRRCKSDETHFCTEFQTKYKECDPNKLLIEFECELEMEKKRLLEEHQRIELHKIAPTEETISKHETPHSGLSLEGTQTVNVLQSTYNSFIPLKKGVGILLGISAICMIYGFLHKVNRRPINLYKLYIFFTPIGSWIRNRFSNKKYTRSNINYEFNSVYNYAQNLRNPYYNIRDVHNIGYHTG